MFKKAWNRLYRSASERCNTTRATTRSFAGIENLEDRRCLSANPLVVNPAFEGISLTAADFNPTPGGNLAAAQVPASFAGKIGANLWSVVESELAAASSTGSVTADINPHAGTIQRSLSGDMEIVIDIVNWSANTLSELEAYGIETTLSNQSLQKVQGWAVLQRLTICLVIAT